MSLADEFLDAFGRPPAKAWSAPGRVNLIGEHTDYNGGLVLPFAIEARTTAAIRPRDDGLLRLRSCQHPDEVLDLPLHDVVSAPLPGWTAYAAGVFGVLALHGYDIRGAEVMVDGRVPPGAGLSSSAALECAVAAAAVDVFGLPLTRAEVAAIAQEAENRFVGVPCGPMDQQIAMLAEEGCALLIDCASGATRHVPFAPERADLRVLVVDTRDRHTLADGAYAERRHDCERAAAEAGVAHLSEIAPHDLPGLLRRLHDDEMCRLVRHVVTENARVRAAVAALDIADVSALGPLLSASHRSLRDDFRVSSAAQDLAVDVMLDAGALGARMIGGGFGGSAIGLIPGGRREQILAAVMAAFAAAGLAAPETRFVAPGQGAHADGVVNSRR